MKQLISIIAPMYNEEKLVSQYCAEMYKEMKNLNNQYDFEIILVNDGSKDDTLKNMLKSQNDNIKEVTIINLSRNFGLEGAISAGLTKAKGDAVVAMDADLQDPPRVIIEMIKKFEEGYDVVTAARIKRESDTLFKKASAKLFYKLMDILSGKLKLEKSAANFRLLSRKAVDIILSFGEINSVFRVSVPYVGLKSSVVEYERDKRYIGTTKYNLKSMISYALNSITSISIEPLRKIFWTVPFSFFIAIIFFISIFLSNDLWQATFVILTVVSIFFGLLFLCVSLIAEYIAQITVEAKGRPNFIIDDYIPCDNTKRRET